MQRIGTFQVTSGRIVVSDPCYEGGDKEFPAKNGTWVGLIDSHDFGREFLGGVRVMKLVAYREGYENAERHDEGDSVGVDSGQMSISDGDKYRYLPGDAYNEVCQATSPAGIIDGFAVASSSGWGDGGYMLRIAKADGKVVGAEVVFIAEAQTCPNCARRFTPNEPDIVLCDDCYAEEDSEYCSECGNLTPNPEMRDGMCEECFQEWSEKHTCLTCGCVAEDEIEDGECEHCRAEHHISG